MTPLRMKMFAVLQGKNLPQDLQEKYVTEVAALAASYKESPDHLSPEQVYSDTFELGDLKLLVAHTFQIRLDVRREIVDFLVLKRNVNGKLAWNDFGQRIVDLKTMPSTDPRHSTAYGDVGRHMDANDDWSVEEFLWSYLDLQHASDDIFTHFLEQVVHPVVRESTESEEWVATINHFLRKVGLQLYVHENLAGYPIWKIRQGGGDTHLSNLREHPHLHAADFGVNSGHFRSSGWPQLVWA